MNKDIIKSKTFLKISTAIFGIISLSVILCYGIGIFKYYNSYIETNGVSIRHVVSDEAIWNLKIITEADTTKEALNKLQSDKKLVLEFLKDSGFNQNEISEEPTTIEDNFRYSVDKNKARFSVTGAFCIQSQNLEAIKNSTIKVSKLMENNIRPESKIRYLYKNMDKLRIDMIKEATKDSKNRAEKIADSLDAKIIGIRNISTGRFSIFSEDASVLSENDWNEGEDSIKKRVKVVVHGAFNLK